MTDSLQALSKSLGQSPETISFMMVLASGMFLMPLTELLKKVMWFKNVKGDTIMMSLTLAGVFGLAKLFGMTATPQELVEVSLAIVGAGIITNRGFEFTKKKVKG